MAVDVTLEHEIINVAVSDEPINVDAVRRARGRRRRGRRGHFGSSRSSTTQTGG